MPSPECAVQLLTADSDGAEIDKAIKIFEHNTPPRLRTDSAEIRNKIASPRTIKGLLYFPALYRGPKLIGFAEFGYYPSVKLVIIDHMVIDPDERGDLAFLVFTGLLMHELHDLAIDYAAIEVELKSKDRASGVRMMRLLTRADFCRAEVKYCLPATDTENLDERYEGALMLKSMHEDAQEFTQIRRVEIERIVKTILFNHYYDWYRDFWSGAKLRSYKAYVDLLFKEFKNGIKGEYVAVTDVIKSSPLPLPPIPPPPPRSPWTYVGLFAAIVAICVGSINFLNIPDVSVPYELLTFLAVFAGFVLVMSGGASEVYHGALKAVSRGRSRRATKRSKSSSSSSSDRGQDVNENDENGKS